MNGGVCPGHGATRRICSYDGCNNFAKQGGVCNTHGARTTPCSHEGCTKRAQNNHLCFEHGKKKPSYTKVSSFTNYSPIIFHTMIKFFRGGEEAVFLRGV
jgi:hypothetical protein